MAITLTEEERERYEEMDDDELRVAIERNERKRRRIDAEKKAYASACKDMIDMLNAQTDTALDVLEKRQLSVGELKPPGPEPVVSFPTPKEADSEGAPATSGPPPLPHARKTTKGSKSQATAA